METYNFLSPSYFIEFHFNRWMFKCIIQVIAHPYFRTQWQRARFILTIRLGIGWVAMELRFVFWHQYWRSTTTLKSYSTQSSQSSWSPQKGNWNIKKHLSMVIQPTNQPTNLTTTHRGLSTECDSIVGKWCYRNCLTQDRNQLLFNGFYLLALFKDPKVLWTRGVKIKLISFDSPIDEWDAKALIDRQVSSINYVMRNI